MTFRVALGYFPGRLTHGRSMITIKQLHALYWIVQLGTFERAAAKLHTTQSAISKRIVELESATGFPVLDRTQRGIRLTDKGEHLLAFGEQVLELEARILDLKDAKDLPARRLRLGVTELSALTWLPRLVARLRASYPGVVIEPEVDMSRALYERLQDDTVDVIVIPEAFSDPNVTTVSMADVSNVWMASPGLVPSRRTMTMDELAESTILTQGSRSGSGLYLTKWLRAQGISFPNVLTSDSLVALAGLAVAGLGVAYLPRLCFQSLLDQDKLRVVATRPALPPVPYAAFYRNDRPANFTSEVARIAAEICDFSRQFQG